MNYIKLQRKWFNLSGFLFRKLVLAMLPSWKNYLHAKSQLL